MPLGWQSTSFPGFFPPPWQGKGPGNEVGWQWLATLKPTKLNSIEEELWKGYHLRTRLVQGIYQVQHSKRLLIVSWTQPDSLLNTAIIVVQFAAILQSIILIVGNFFTVFVFWKHRNTLKRTSFLLINLAVADLLVGFTEPISLGAINIPVHFEERIFNSAQDKNISIAFEVTFSFVSVFFLALISLERGYALIWLLRHQVPSTKGCIYSATFAWISATFTGGQWLC